MLGSMAARIQNCVFQYNTVVQFGGGIAIYGGSKVERGIDIDGCTFSNNRAFNGGGVHYYEFNGTDHFDMKSCVFDTNQASNWGGGLFIDSPRNGPSGITIDSCNFIGNIAKYGAAIDNFTLNGAVFDGDFLIKSCLFTGNKNIFNGERGNG